ncbi:MAG: ABC transporter permease [Syntrophaceae bacterium]|nr:ABC transporter permease [Syntrophaceae bacterium]
MEEMITIYEPDNSLRKGYLSIFGQIFTELKQNRWLTYQLFKRDFLSAYKQSLLGVLWAIILPLVSIAIFIVLNRSGILNIGDIGVPYSIYALLGIAFWQFFSNGLVACSNSLVNAGPMILKINFSKKSLVIAAAAKAIVPFAIQIAMVCILFVGYGRTPSIMGFLIPIFLIPLVLFTLGLGFFTSLLNGVVRDIGNIISILLMFLMFFTPVLYAKPKIGFLVTVTKYNPLYYLVSAPRDLILKGSISEWQGFLIVCLIAVILFFVCLFGFHLTETRVAERI